MVPQKGGMDCGLFAIAYAEKLVSGVDPTTVVFDQSAMRQHLISCVGAAELSAFPSTSSRVVRRKVSLQFDVQLYCTCHGGSITKERMIMCDQCHEWYHQSCIRMTDAVFMSFVAIRNIFVAGANHDVCESQSFN